MKYYLKTLAIIKKLAKKTYKLHYFKNRIVLLVSLSTLSSALAIPDRVEIEIGPWSYGYDRCQINGSGFNSVLGAEEAGMNAVYPSDSACGTTVKTEDNGFPPEDNGIPEDILHCGYDVTVPNYRYDEANYNLKTIKVEYHQYDNSDIPVCRTYLDSMAIDKFRFVGCPKGYNKYPPEYDPKLGKYMCNKDYDLVDDGDQCGSGTNKGNPINIATGNKYHSETIDFFNDSFDMSLNYNSRRAINGFLRWNLGRGWTHNYAKSISNKTFSESGEEVVFIYRGTGRGVYFQKTNGTWINQSSSSEMLLQNGENWVVKTTGNVIENYNKWGELTSEERDGRLVSILRDSSRRISKLITNNEQFIEFGYPNNSEIYPNSFTDQDDNQWVLTYNGSNILSKITYPDNTEKVFHYENNTPYLLTGITDRRGVRFATYDYDSEGRAFYEKHHAKDLLGNDINVEELTINYNPDPTQYSENTRLITNSLGHVSIYEVEKTNGPWKIKSEMGPGCSACGNDNTSFEYDSDGNLISKTRDGVTTEYGNYDNKGQYAYKIVAVGTVDAVRTDYNYDNRFIGKITKITKDSVSGQGNKKVTDFVYNESGQMISMTVNGFKHDGTSISQSTTYEYNGPFGQISKIDGPRLGDIDATIYEYYDSTVTPESNRNRLNKVTGPEAIVERDNVQWTSTGKLKSEQRPNGITITNSYHPLNDLLETMTQNDGSTSVVTKFTYLATGDIHTVTQNYGTSQATTMTLTYDDALRVTRVTDHSGNYMEYNLDTEGNQKHETTYDPQGNLKKQISQLFDAYDFIDKSTQSGVTVDYDYGSSGVLYQLKNGNNVVTDYSYDNLKRLTQITEDYQGGISNTANTITSFEYDESGRVNKVTDARNNATEYIYDDFGNLRKLVSPDTGITLYDYDEVGNMISKTDANNITVVMSYDGRNRITSVDYIDDSLDTSFTYDKGVNNIGRLSSFSDSTGTTTYIYDAFGRLLEKNQQIKGFDSNTYQGFNDIKSTYSYDAYGRQDSLTYPTGLSINYEYNEMNLVNKISTSIGGQAVDIVDNVIYLPFGPIKSIDYGNGKNYSASYDNGYRLQNYSYGSDVFMEFNYDNNHNILNIDDSNVSGGNSNQDYWYDDLDRLTRDESQDVNVFTYDKLGNRTSIQKDSSPTITYQIDSNSNKLTQIDNNFPRTYDNNGNNLTQPDVGNDSWTYNQANRMSQYNTSSIIRAKYHYNALGQRVLKTKYKNNGFLAGEFIFLYDEQGQLIHESKYRNGLHIWDRETIWLGNRPVARVETIYTSGTVTSQQIYYIQTDHLNTPRWITNEKGTRIWSWESDAFGTTEANIDVDGDGNKFYFNMRFPGQFLDNESGKHYNYFRDYEPGTGRYVQSDPIGQKGSINTYIYASNNPLYWTDSTGLINDNGKCTGVPIQFQGGCRNPPPPPSCKDGGPCSCEERGDCCEKSWSSCMNDCVSFLNPWWSTPLGGAVGFGAAGASGASSTIACGWAGAAAGAWGFGSSAGCSLRCLTDPCYEY